MKTGQLFEMAVRMPSEALRQIFAASAINDKKMGLCANCIAALIAKESWMMIGSDLTADRDLKYSPV